MGGIMYDGLRRVNTKDFVGRWLLVVGGSGWWFWLVVVVVVVVVVGGWWLGLRVGMAVAVKVKVKVRLLRSSRIASSEAAGRRRGVREVGDHRRRKRRPTPNQQPGTRNQQPETTNYQLPTTND